ncbi:MAG: dTDP-4-dehydrorhamnose reductase [PVC group bacterium]|nr:dTDP-4-dehydrorhamnose reductase [PVC group bacterium]
MEEAKKKILITGINGMLGADLIKQLCNKYCIAGIDITSSEKDGIECVLCDITDEQQVEDVFLRLAPWGVIHAAAYTNVDGCEQDTKKAYLINAEGTKNVATVCKKTGAKLIYISTDYVFDGKNTIPYKETDSPNPLNEYGRTKLAGEEFVRAYADEFLIVRTSWLFGLAGKNFVRTIIEKAGEVEQLKVVNDQTGSPTHTVSLAQAIDKLIDSVFLSGSETEHRDLFHVSNSGSCTWYEFAKKILELNELKTEIIPVDSSVVSRPAKRPHFSVIDNSYYQQITADELCSWQEALRCYLNLMTSDV